MGRGLLTTLGRGVVFKLTPKGKETILYSFCQQGYPCLDGTQPFSVLVFDKEGNLYGTSGGGTNDNCDRDGCGVVFKVTPKDKETALYDFCPSRGSSCSDGFWPSAGLVFDQKGNLYGTANHGGSLWRWCRIQAHSMIPRPLKMGTRPRSEGIGRSICCYTLIDQSRKCRPHRLRTTLPMPRTPLGRPGRRQPQSLQSSRLS